MSRDEAARVLAALASAWPQVTVNADTAEMWFNSTLERLPFETALQVVLRIVETEEWFPSVARFNDMRRAVGRRAAEDQPTQIGAGASTLEGGGRAVRIARLIVAETPGWGTLDRPERGGERVHHHGVEPGQCSFCQERFKLSDAELDERLSTVGVS